METIILIGLVVILIGVWRLYPNIVLPRCPVCYTEFDSIEQRDAISGWDGWQVVWHRFVCPSCGYRWRRPELTRSSAHIKSNRSS